MGKHNLKLTSIEYSDIEEQSIVKPELNLERWGGLFVPSQARGRHREVRTLTRETKLSNGNTITDSVSIDYCSYGTLTTKDQRVLYALLHLWYEKGCPLTYCHFSIYRLMQILKMNMANYGSHDVESILDSLRRLRGVLLTFKQCFYDADTKDTYKDEEPINILSTMRTRQRQNQNDNASKSKTYVDGYFLFHPRILKNLIRNHTRPVRLDVILSLRSDIAQLIYNLVDRQIVGKYIYYITTENLFRELDLKGKKYKSVSGRKQALEKPLTELVGKPLSSGGIISSVELVVTKSGNDYKVVFAKKDKPQRLQPAKSETIKHPTPSNVIEIKPEILPPQEDKHTLFLLSELRAVGITEGKARKLVTQYPDECAKQLESFRFRDLSKVKNKAAWLITAITQGYAIAEEAEQRKQEAERKQNKEAEMQARSNCKFCEHSPGWHIIYLERHPNGAAKPCTHNPEEEAKYKSSRFADSDDEEAREEEPIELQEQESVECDFCHPFAPGFHRIVTTEEVEGWTLRKCSHDSIIESQFETLM